MNEEEEHESYQDRRDRDYREAAKHHKERLDPDHQETQAEYAEILNRDDEVLDTDEEWNETFFEVTVRFRWSQICRYTEGAMEAIEMVDEDPVGSAIDAHLEPHYDTDVTEVVSKTHRTAYTDG